MNSAVATTHGRKRFTVPLSIFRLSKFFEPERGRPNWSNCESIRLAIDHWNEETIAIKSDIWRGRARTVYKVVQRLFGCVEPGVSATDGGVEFICSRFSRAPIAG